MASCGHGERSLLVVGVGQPDNVAAVCKFNPPSLPAFDGCFHELAVGVGHPEEALSHLRRTEARSAKIDNCDGVFRLFQVSLYSVEPCEAVLACNLFTKDNVRAALRYKVKPCGPQVAGVVESPAFSRLAERLAGAGTRPDGATVRPSGASQGVRPDADPGEEMALCEAFKVIGGNFLN